LGVILERIIKAFYNSAAAWRHLIASEKAFQQEAAVLASALPMGWFIAADAQSYLMLVGSVLLVLIVEVLNTGLEAACDAFTREFHANIKIAKDCGSLAVLLSILLSAGVWGVALWERFGG
jgi:diacylglycerol kinase (ATP)